MKHRPLGSRHNDEISVDVGCDEQLNLLSTRSNVFAMKSKMARIQADILRRRFNICSQPRSVRHVRVATSFSTAGYASPTHYPFFSTTTGAIVTLC